MQRLSEPFDRLARVFGEFGVNVGNLMLMHQGIELCFRDIGYEHPDFGDKWWHADKVAPVVWFGEAWLDTARSSKRSAMASYQRALRDGEITEDEPEWSFFGPWHIDGDTIKLRAANGTWIWVLTGRSEMTTRPDEEDEVMWEGRWPD